MSDLPLVSSHASPAHTVLYCVCATSPAAALAAGTLDGLEPSHSTRVVEEAGIAALVIDVPAAYLVGPDAESRLGDLQWVAPRAVRHEQLIRAVMAHGPVLPLAFGTAFSSEASLRTVMRIAAPHVLDFLKRVENTAELGVRILHDPDRTLASLRQDLLLRSPPPKTPGARYLFEKKLDEQAARSLRAHIDSLSRAALDELAPLAREVVERRSTLTHEHQLKTASYHAMLVDADVLQAFAERARGLSDRLSSSGVIIELTGPWPPYSFCPQLGAIP
ncbi:MAG: GvpL/GvpF family gas vesicle protein [Planctomycetota bacterium]|nr:GvpL/GvpF family gas vesicle protein [Planctomycetota bacterium]